MKTTCLFILSFISSLMFAQQTGSFEDTVTFNSTPRRVSMFVPNDYDDQTKSPLVIGLHGCVGGNTPSDGFRNTISFLADSIGAVIACPNGIVGNAQMDDPDHLIISTTIDSVMSWYNIDSQAVYITGFSCNGFTAAKHGTRELYPWAGVFPINAWFSMDDVDNLEFKLDNNTKTCICSGTSDPAYDANEYLFDFLESDSKAYFNSIPGVGHTTNFSSLRAEVMECFHWFNDLVSNSIEVVNTDFQVIVSNNQLSINSKTGLKDYTISNIEGKVVYQGNDQIVDLNKFNSGIYFLKASSSRTLKFIVK